MADSKDYLTVYKRFFDNFAKTVNPDDQLPVRVAGYRLWDNEVVGETVDWTLQYLTQRDCPPSLLAPITRIVIDEIKQLCETQPLSVGFKMQENCYLPLKLMKAVTNKVTEVCLRFCDNGRIITLPPPSSGPLISSCAIKNSRRCMEDRHVILEDFHAFFNIKDTSPASYYAVFDGHAGTDAASYSVSHLHQFLAESSYYPTDPEKAIKDAFFRTDNLFIEKSNKENLQSGTTAVCALLRPKEKKLYVAWLGDSQAVLVRNGQTIQLVNPHKPERKDEMTRIQLMGGTVIFWGTWRVNGQLAVSRAIGDMLYKPYVSAEPDVRTVDLRGDEDFLILACDGLWDYVAAVDVVQAVYDQVRQNPADLQAVTQKLVVLSKQQGSTDNITVIVTFLTDPSQLAAREPAPRPWTPTNVPQQHQHPQQQQPSAPAMEAFDLNTNSGMVGGVPAAPAPVEHGNPFEPSSNPFETELSAQKAAAAAGLLLDLDVSKVDPFQAPPFNNGHANGNLYDFLERPANGMSPPPANAVSAAVQRDDEDDDDEDDSGPENDGDARASPLGKKKNPFADDVELQRQQLSEFDSENEPRQETPTPPADAVPGVIGLVSDNVAESGEESEDEWNYYRVDPTEKPQPSAEKEPQTKQEVCGEQPLTVEESDENMESQLNPNAAEFIPSPTHSKPSMEEILSQTQASEADSFLDKSVSSVNTTDLLAAQEKELDEKQNESLLSEKDDLVNKLNDESRTTVDESPESGATIGLDESEAFSTKAVLGDEYTATSDLQKILETSSNLTETSSVEQDFLACEEQTEIVTGNLSEPGIVEKDIFQEDLINEFQKEPVHISFELQKEIAPHMESQPERVKVDSEEQSPTQESEPDLQISDNTPETKVTSETVDLILNDESSVAASAVEDFLTVPVPGLEGLDIDRTEEDATAKIEEILNFTEHSESEIDFKQRNSDQLISMGNFAEISKPVENMDFSKFSAFPAVFTENQPSEPKINVDVHSQLSEFPESQLTGEISVQHEPLNQLSNEISTPEYEKMEKDIEASEQYQDKVNSTDTYVPTEVTLSPSNSGITVSDVLLESAHPDREALLDDACVETSADIISMEIPPNEEFTMFDNESPNVSSPVPDLLDPAISEFISTGVKDISSAPDSVAVSDPVLLEENTVEQKVVSHLPVEPIPFDSVMSNGALGRIAETVSPYNTFDEQLSQSNLPDELANVTSAMDSCTNIPSNEVMSSDTLLDELLESNGAPPPTPLISQFDEGENENFSEAVKKLSVTQHSEEIGDLQEVKETIPQGNVEVALENSQPVVESKSIPSLNSDAILSVTEVTELKTSVSAESSNELITQELLNEEKSDTVISGTDDVAVVAAVAGGITAAASAAVAMAASGVTSTDKEVKKEKEVSAKKLTTSLAKDKKLSTDKTKTATKAPVVSRLTATTTKLKSPTSPVKPPTASKTAPTRPSSSTIPGKPQSKPTLTKTATKPLSSAPLPARSTAASRPKPSSVSARPSPPTVNLSRTRPASAPVEKKPLTNGEIKTAPKRPELIPSKAPATKASPRLNSSPATKTITKTFSATSTVAKPKAPLNGPSKPRPLSSVTQIRTVTKASNEKEIKETANKQISTRTTTSTVRSTTTATASKTSVTSASRKIESKELTNGKGPSMKTSSMVRTTTTATRIAPKKPATTTRLKTTKTDSIVEKSETLQGSKTVIATNE